MAYKVPLVFLLLAFFLLPASTLAGEGELDSQPRMLRPATAAQSGTRIVNGVGTNLFPSTISLISTSGQGFCTGTMIGCSTVLTASHCVCDSTGANCGPGGADLTSPASIGVFSQHAGIQTVASVHVPPNYVFEEEADVAILKLATPIEGIAPSLINTSFRPAFGNAGLLVGFGLASGSGADSGLKRYGFVTTASCNEVPNSKHICWQYTNPIGPPGQDSNTCRGDSGGPLFMNFGDGLAVTGVTSGGINTSCSAPDDAWDADVFVERSWISNTAGADLSSAPCGELAPAGSFLSPIFIGAGDLSAAEPTDDWTHEVSANTDVVHFALNGERGNVNDFDLYIKFGQAASPANYDCRSESAGNFENCRVTNPTAGTWHIHVARFEGDGAYQASATNLKNGIFADGLESSLLSEWSATKP